jgi:hypothetical protein
MRKCLMFSSSSSTLSSARLRVARVKTWFVGGSEPPSECGPETPKAEGKPKKKKKKETQFFLCLCVFVCLSLSLWFFIYNHSACVSFVSSLTTSPIKRTDLVVQCNTQLCASGVVLWELEYGSSAYIPLLIVFPAFLCQTTFFNCVLGHLHTHTQHKHTHTHTHTLYRQPCRMHVGLLHHFTHMNEGSGGVTARNGLHFGAPFNSETPSIFFGSFISLLLGTHTEPSLIL